MKKSLKKILKEYKETEDIIIFGSFVKDKFKPKDIDIAVINQKKDLTLIGEISHKLSENIHIEFLYPHQIYTTRIGLSIISEGFSIKKNKFLRDLIGAKPMKIYCYELKEFAPSKKRQFHRALKEHIKKTKATKLGSGSIMIPIEKTGFFEDFLDIWKIKYKTKEYLIL